MIPFKSKLEGMRLSEARNLAFHKLTDVQKRKEVAFDILKSYISGWIKPQTWDPRFWPEKQRKVFKKLPDAKSLQKEVSKSRKVILCDVCMRGALMVSRICLGNQIDPQVDNFVSGEKLDDTYSSCVSEFEVDDLETIENFYENDGFLTYERRTPECIAAIAANILTNGRFDSEDETDYLSKWKVKIRNKSSIKQMEENWL